MILDFLNNSNAISNKSRQHKQQIEIVRFISKSKTACIIPEIAKQLKISIPTINKLIAELRSADLLIEVGKKDTGSGRKPILYALNKNRFYSVGVDIQLKGLKIILLDIDLNIVKQTDISEFQLENNQQCLDEIENQVHRFLETIKIDKSSILGIGISLTGRINTKIGASLSYFDFLEKPLSKYLSEHLMLPVLLDNDTRLIGLAEQASGKLSEVKDALIVNVSRGLGVSIISEGSIIKGSNGFAGEFGHMQFGMKNRLCICGKSNCLGTEVSGYALELDFLSALQEGKDSLLKQNSDIYYFQNIIEGAISGDRLAIELIQQQGTKLGECLGSIINLLNPSLIVIAGGFSSLGDIFIDAVRIGLSKTALVNPLKSCRIVSSSINGQAAAAIGAASMSFKKYDVI